MEGFNYISVYTRAEAIEDGVLIDVSKTEAGFKYPVAVTSGVWAEVVVPDEKAKKCGESERGRLWDLISMMRISAKQSKGAEIKFKVIATVEGKEKLHDLRAVVGPGDRGEPVVLLCYLMKINILQFYVYNGIENQNIS
ncbi:DUF6573 family protein [Peribacillus frigoritolerans]|uniref:DUF6573 family protein n=1 Tax=Peribacillus frigoritolerans TaxID=450367 RepID=UPI002417480C|nr:DUF6573 family protein [Peribacillus frigoritolerans]MDG4850741.1 hypothetical protein [Peribacillus frigoritolerans]